MTPRTVVVHRDVPALAGAVAARVVTTLTAALSARPQAHLVLTGGRVGTATLVELRALADTVEWPRVHIWWGDERFLPTGHEDRNETQARAALLDHVDLDPGHIHPMASSDDAADPETSAARYAEVLAAHDDGGHGTGVPEFDILLLGVGDDGHIGSLFPEHPGVYVTDRMVTGVRGSPKPPPERVSLTLPAIQAAREVWLVVAGGDKAKAVALAMSGAGAVQIPAAGAQGRSRTLWLLDPAAAADIPPGLVRLASP